MSSERSFYLGSDMTSTIDIGKDITEQSVSQETIFIYAGSQCSGRSDSGSNVHTWRPAEENREKSTFHRSLYED